MNARCSNTNQSYIPQLVAVLREVKYLEIRGTSNIPESAANMYAKNEVLRQYVANMDLTVHWYNRVSNNHYHHAY